MSEPITVRGARADAYRTYRDLREDSDRTALSAYRTVLLRSPGRMDAQTIALVLHGHVRFAAGARDVLRSVFDGEDDATVPYDALRPHLRANDAAKAVITACEPACPAALIDALTLLFIAANAKSITVESPDELPAEGGDASDTTDVPEEPPTGYGG